MRELGAEPHLAPKARNLVLHVSRRVALPEPERLDGDVLPGRELTGLVDPPEATFPELGEDLVPRFEYGTDGQHARLAPRRLTTAGGFHSSTASLPDNPAMQSRGDAHCTPSA